MAELVSFSFQGLNGVLPVPSQLGRPPWKAVPEPPKPVLGVVVGAAVDPKPPLVPNALVPVAVPKPVGLAPPKRLPPAGVALALAPKPPVVPVEPNPPPAPKPPVVPAV